MITVKKTASLGWSDAHSLTAPPMLVVFDSSINDLPTIIDGPGDYLTRNRWRVTIHKVTPLESTQTTAFRAKGSFWKTPQKMGTNPRYDIWHVSGRHSIFKENSNDIVARWPA